MEIFDGFVNGGRFDAVPVKAAAGLPKAAVGPMRIDDGQLLQKCRGVPSEVSDGTGTDWLLDGMEYRAHVVELLAWSDKQMGMVWHDDPGPQIKITLDSCIRDSIDKPEPRAVFAKQGKPAEAREGEGMSVPFNLIVLHGLKWVAHAGEDNGYAVQCKRIVNRMWEVSRRFVALLSVLREQW